MIRFAGRLLLSIGGVFACAWVGSALAAGAAPNQKLLDHGRRVSLTVGGVGCAGCHGAYGEGDVGIGPYNRGVSLSKIQASVVAVDAMAFLKGQLKPGDIEAVAAYYSWLGQHQLVKALVKRGRFLPDTVDIHPGTAVQFVLKNSSRFDRKFASDNLGIDTFAVKGRTSHDFVWTAPASEGVYSLHCVDCRIKRQQLKINVTRSAKPHLLPDRTAVTVAAADASTPAPAAAAPPDDQTIAYGRELFLTAGEVGCTACHGPYAEGDVGIGPYNRGFSETAIRTALRNVEAMQFLSKALDDRQVDQIAAYYGWLGKHQLIKSRVVRGRFFPDRIEVRPGTRIQLAISNRDHATVKVAGGSSGIEPFEVAPMETGDTTWTAPGAEATFELKCVNCASAGTLTVAVTPAADAPAPPVEIK